MVLVHLSSLKLPRSTYRCSHIPHHIPHDIPACHTSAIHPFNKQTFTISKRSRAALGVGIA